MQLSDTTQSLYKAMSQVGTLLPTYMVTDNNRDAQMRMLSLIAGMVGMARSQDKALAVEGITPSALYAALDGAYALEASGIYSFDEALTLLGEVYEQTVNPPYPPLLIPRPGFEDGEPLEVLYGVNLEKFAGKLSGRKRMVWGELLEDLQKLGAKRYPWRIGTSREEHSEPFVIGPAPDEPSLDD
ncbi:MAG: hypothetical protein ACI8RZ_002610 [Myxococcota bacterium]|jgi:hypothetical protein